MTAVSISAGNADLHGQDIWRYDHAPKEFAYSAASIRPALAMPASCVVVPGSTARWRNRDDGMLVDRCETDARAHGRGALRLAMTVASAVA